MNFSRINNLQPSNTSQLIEMALRELHIERDPNMDDTMNDLEVDDREFLNRRRTVDDRVLTPRMVSLDNSLTEHLNSSIPSLDEIVIRQRGRQKKPSKISWSPIKSPFKTPTKNTLHMSLLSPSPAKKLFNNNNNSSMVLRNSPRKRIFADSQNDQDPASSSTPYATPTKRLKFIEDRPMNAINPPNPPNPLNYPRVSARVPECPRVSARVPECPRVSTSVHECPRSVPGVSPECPRSVPECP